MKSYRNLLSLQYFVKKYKLNKMNIFQKILQIKKQERINKIKTETLFRTLSIKFYHIFKRKINLQLWLKKFFNV
jgi:hypothetical protein